MIFDSHDGGSIVTRVAAAEYFFDDHARGSGEKTAGSPGADYNCPSCDRRLDAGHIGLTWICGDPACPTTTVVEGGVR
jgi:hypothetical protein